MKLNAPGFSAIAYRASLTPVICPHPIDPEISLIPAAELPPHIVSQYSNSLLKASKPENATPFIPNAPYLRIVKFGSRRTTFIAALMGFVLSSCCSVGFLNQRPTSKAPFEIPHLPPEEFMPRGTDKERYPDRLPAGAPAPDPKAKPTPTPPASTTPLIHTDIGCLA